VETAACKKIVHYFLNFAEVVKSQKSDSTVIRGGGPDARRANPKE